MIYSMEGRNLDAGREPVGNEGGTDTDYIWVLGFRSGTRLGGRIADPNITLPPGNILVFIADKWGALFLRIQSLKS